MNIFDMIREEIRDCRFALEEMEGCLAALDAADDGMGGDLPEAYGIALDSLVSAGGFTTENRLGVLGEKPELFGERLCGLLNRLAAYSDTLEGYLPEAPTRIRRARLEQEGKLPS